MTFDLYKFARPFLQKMDAEDAHGLAIRALQVIPLRKISDDPALAQTIWGLNFPNPIGIAAGFDKNAAVLDGLHACGFGFVEAGTVTPLPQPGNDRPRVFRDVNSRSVINRMGFPGAGADVFMKNFCARKGTGIAGINIGKNKTTEDAASDYLKLAGIFGPMADYITVNISSPNTPGLRDLQKRDFLLPLIADLKKTIGARHTPILIKLAPDLTDAQSDELAATLLEAQVDGIIIGNTTLDRPAQLPADFIRETGGLSGPLLRVKSTALIKRFYNLTQRRIPIIGVGGISSGLDAYEKIRNGASLVQLYTALIYEGPALVSRIKKDLVALLKRDGYQSIVDAVGTDA
jgi:dihydroorotate dehydrogenase